MRGENVRTEVQVSFEEACFGVSRELDVMKVEICDKCKGTGCAEGTTPEICPMCIRDSRLPGADAQRAARRDDPAVRSSLH